jgi:uncharacterized membrane protein HdeD (DUF308 family)
MKNILIVISIVLVCIGTVWILQGINVLPGSFMSGQSRWTRNGSIVAIIGIASFFIAMRIKKKNRP